jgi:hypothetical protein
MWTISQAHYRDGSTEQHQTPSGWRHKGARVVLSQREAHEHADSGRKRYRNQKAKETEQIAERE